MKAVLEADKCSEHNNFTEVGTTGNSNLSRINGFVNAKIKYKLSSEY